MLVRSIATKRLWQSEDFMLEVEKSKKKKRIQTTVERKNREQKTAVKVGAWSRQYFCFFFLSYYSTYSVLYFSSFRSYSLCLSHTISIQDFFFFFLLSQRRYNAHCIRSNFYIFQCIRMEWRRKAAVRPANQSIRKPAAGGYGWRSYRTCSQYATGNGPLWWHPHLVLCPLPIDIIIFFGNRFILMLKVL